MTSGDGVEVGTAYVSLVVSGQEVPTGVRRAMGAAEPEADRAGKRMGRRFASSFGAMAAGVGAAALGAGTFRLISDSLEEARESAIVGRRTVNVIKQMGNASRVSAKQVGDLASALSAKSGFDDEAVQSGANLLLTFGNIRNELGRGNAIFDRTTRLMVDMSAAMGTDFKSSAVQLGKALNDPVKGLTALSRVGVSFTKQQQDQIKALAKSGDTLRAQRIILGEVERQFGGAAEAMADPSQKLTVAFGNLKEQIGTALLPEVERFQGFLTNKGIPAISGFLDEMRTGKGRGGQLVDFLADVRDVATGAKDRIEDITAAFNKLPEPVRKGALGLGIGAVAAKKIGGAMGAGSLRGATPLTPMFVKVVGQGGATPGGGGPKGGGAVSPGRFAAGAALASAGGVRTYDLTKSNDLGLRMLPKDFPVKLAQLAAARTGVEDITKSIGALDRQAAALIRGNPVKGFDSLALLADKADMSIGQLRRAMPETAAAIDKTGAGARSAARHTGDWQKVLFGTNRELKTLGQQRPNVRVKHNIPSVMAAVGKLDRALDEATLERTARVRLAISQNGDGFGFQRRAMGGPVKAGVPYIVGERRPELFVPDQNGRIEPRVSAGGGGPTFIHQGDIVAPDPREYLRWNQDRAFRAQARG